MIELEMDDMRKKFTALVVDDDIDTVDLFTEFLGVYDCEVLAKAYDGKTAVDMYEKLFPDVVFSDVMMPDHDGFYLLENIRKINPNAVIIMITGDVRFDTIDKLNQLKANAIIQKPFEMQKMISTVHDLLLKNAQLCSSVN